MNHSSGRTLTDDLDKFWCRNRLETEMKHNDYDLKDTLKSLAYPKGSPVLVTPDLPRRGSQMAHPLVERIRGPVRTFMRHLFHDLVLCLFAGAGTSGKDARANLQSRRTLRHGALLLGSILLASIPAGAQNGSPAPRTGEQPSLMNVLSEDGLHDLENESWNAYGQFTYISSWKPSFRAAYTNLNGSINSLLPTAEQIGRAHV